MYPFLFHLIYPFVYKFLNNAFLLIKFISVCPKFFSHI